MGTAVASWEVRADDADAFVLCEQGLGRAVQGLGVLAVGRRCWSHSHFLATCYVGIVLVETFNKHSEGLVEAALLGLARYGAFGVELGA